MILVAFVFGFAATRLRLPPLVGYLAAGFVLHEFGRTPDTGIEAVADIGILLLLFGIGLKLQPVTLARPVVWLTTATHTLIATTAAATALLLAGELGLPLAVDLDGGQLLLLGFALSFSSTVSAVKTLEDRGESAALAGRVAVGILIVQDILAVGYLGFIADEGPTLWALAIIAGIILLRPLFGWLLSNSGHGELLPLLGLALAAGVGAASFDLVGLKPDLGALLIGAVLAAHPRSGELSDRLLSLKDLLLVGFFVSIGLAGAPPPIAWAIGGGLLILLPFQSLAFLLLITRFRLRSRTALHASIALMTFSEFGLIVVVAAEAAGIIDQVWVSATAIAVALSFVLATVLSRIRHHIYRSASRLLAAIERHPVIPEDSVIDLAAEHVIVLGMGRIGTGAYDEIVARQVLSPVGVERKEEIVLAHRADGRNVVRGDALDRDFWDRIRFPDDLRLVVVALNTHASNMECVRRAREYVPGARVAAIAAYPDEVAELRRAGATIARNLYEEAGQALADDALSFLDEALPQDPAVD